MNEKKNIIEEILEIELGMFLSVKAANNPECRNHPDQFKLYRRAQFVTWSKEPLISYLEDLRDALIKGENLMTVKYARMENLIPMENENPLIEMIIAAQIKWQKEMFYRYPFFMAGARPVDTSGNYRSETSFRTYLKGELESYSEKTLQLHYRDINKKLKNKVNMAEEIYGHIVLALGYPSLVSAEKSLENRSIKNSRIKKNPITGE